jgi:GNAT superfamily N-acetyltransferase
MLVRFTQIDYDREMALIGVVEQDGREIEVGVARYMTRPGGDTCEFAIVVADNQRNRGIGARLMRSLMQNARDKGSAHHGGRGADRQHAHAGAGQVARLPHRDRPQRPEPEAGVEGVVRGVIAPVSTPQES